MTVNANQIAALSLLPAIRRGVWAVLPEGAAAEASRNISRGWNDAGFVGMGGALFALAAELRTVEGGYDLYLLCRTAAERAAAVA